MKILHLAQDLEAARVPARAIHAIADDATLAWAGSPGDALEWLRNNPETAAVIVEFEAQSAAPFVREIRASRLQTPVVVVDGSGRLDSAIDALNAGADGYVLVGPALERQLPDVVLGAIDRARERTAMAAELAAQHRRAARDARLCEVLQQQALRLERTLATLETRRATEAEAFASLLDARHKAFVAHLDAVTESHDALAGELAAATMALESIQEQAAADQAALQSDVADAIEAHQQSERRANRILAAALARESELLEVIETESAAKAVAESHVAEARMAAARSRDRSLLVASRYRRHVRSGQAQVMLQLAQERAQADHDRGAAEAIVARLTLERDSLGAQLGAQQELVQDLRATLEAERDAHELTRSIGDSDLRHAQAEMGRLQKSFDELQRAFHQVDEVAGDHAAARLRLEALIAERDSLLAEETERHLAAEDEARREVSRLEWRLRQAADERHAEVARMQEALAALRRELEVTSAEATMLRGVAERVPDLETRLEKSRHEKRRQFERAPYGLCRCSSDGTVLEANHSFVSLLGYRRAEDLKDLSWLTIAKERTGDLGWLLERAQATRKAEAVETLWNTREGGRIIVRLQALAAGTDAIDIVAEDVTTVRVLEERLRQAQKMEAVGRLASEVAVTCDALLGDVVRDATDWSERAQSVELRSAAQRILEELTRARGFMRRLGSYGDEQKRSLEPASAQRVLHQLAPVMKRLVGERVELVLPKTGGAFPVDVDAERLERVLTNIAAYARERMPTGGQVKIDLATIAIGRRFAAGHSNVRAGDHVLITVTELPSAGTRRGDTPGVARPADSGGMELGVLMELISSCGGHLWLEAQPAGNMVIKIHLPKAAGQPERVGRRLPRWLRAASAANLLA